MKTNVKISKGKQFNEFSVDIAKLCLELCGGGLSTQQTTKAMALHQKRIRQLFRKDNHNLDFKKRNGQYCTDTRCAFVDYIDYLNKSGLISDKLAQKATL